MSLLLIISVFQHSDQLQDLSKTEVKNTNLLYKVIDVLNVAVEMGVGIHPDDLVTKRKNYQKKKKKQHSGLLPDKTLKP